MYCTKRFWIDFYNLEITYNDRNAVGDSQCNENDEVLGNEEKVVQNVSICFTRFFMLLDKEFHLEI